MKNPKNLTGRYILNEDGQPVECPDIGEWGRWMELGIGANPRRVSYTVIQDDPGVYVSTVFLGLDHGFGRDERNTLPVLWETMVFGGPMDGEQDRYETKNQAIAGHLTIVDEVRKALENV